MSEEKKYHSHTKVYIGVLATLIVLTVITVYVSYFDFKEWNIFVAMLVATIKATLVCLFFMHLKYDNRMNQVIFISSLVFLAIFIGLTLSDELERPTVAEAKVQAVQGPQGDQTAKMNELRISNPTLVAKGKTVYQAQCAACHGASGQGDGPAAAALVPKPRNFASAEGWKQGRAPSQIFNTITKGVPETPMAAFSTLSVEDRWSLVHYIQTITPNPPPDNSETLALLGLTEGGGSSVKPTQETVTIPISYAIDRLVEEENRK